MKSIRNVHEHENDDHKSITQLLQTIFITRCNAGLDFVNTLLMYKYAFEIESLVVVKHLLYIFLDCKSFWNNQSFILFIGIEIWASSRNLAGFISTAFACIRLWELRKEERVHDSKNICIELIFQ